MCPERWEYQVGRYRCRGGKPRLRSVGGLEVHNDGKVHGAHGSGQKKQITTVKATSNDGNYDFRKRRESK